jgi:hypothetical protein
LVRDWEVRGEWRRLQSEELHDLYCYQIKYTGMIREGHVARRGNRIGA